MCHARPITAPKATTRQIIHALLDMVVSQDESSTDEQNMLAAATAFEQLNEIGALTVEVDDETGEFHANVTPLLTAIGVLIDTPVRLLADRMEADRLAVINTIREHFDRVFPDIAEAE